MSNTLKTFTDDLLALTRSHAQVEMCHIGTITDISNPKDGTAPAYPYVFYVIDNVNFDNANIVVQLTGIFMTKNEDTEDQEQQAYSDMTEIARDIYAHYTIQDGESSWGIQRLYNVIGNPFVERFEDNVTGVAFQMEFDIDVAASKCYFPTRP